MSAYVVFLRSGAFSLVQNGVVLDQIIDGNEPDVTHIYPFRTEAEAKASYQWTMGKPLLPTIRGAREPSPTKYKSLEGD